MVARGLLGHEAVTFHIENLGLNIPDILGADPRVTYPQQLVHTCGCLVGITQTIPTQDETMASNSDDNQPEAPEHTPKNHPQRTGGKNPSALRCGIVGD